MTNQQRDYWKERIQEKAKHLRKTNGGIEVSEDEAEKFLREIEIDEECGQENNVFDLVEIANQHKRRYEWFLKVAVDTLKDSGVSVSEYAAKRKDHADQVEYIIDKAKHALSRRRQKDGAKERITITERSLLDDLMAGHMPEDPRVEIDRRFESAVNGEAGTDE